MRLARRLLNRSILRLAAQRWEGGSALSEFGTKAAHAVVDSVAEIGLADTRIVGQDRRGAGQGNRPGFQHESAA